MITNNQLAQCIEVASKFGVKRLVLFGSCLESLSTARDIDLLCDGIKDEEYFTMSAEMEAVTGANVDIVPVVPKTPFVDYNMCRGRVLYVA